MLLIQWFGYPTIRLNGLLINEFISNKVVMLFAYLTIENRVHARDKLSALFWGDLAEDRSKANLRQALHNLQKLVPDYFEVTRQTVRFVAEKDHSLDIASLINFNTGVGRDNVESLQAIIDSYQGDFFEGIMISGTPELEHWLHVQREYYRLQAISLIEQVAQHFKANADWNQSIYYHQRLLTIEPWREASHCELMLLFARQGNHHKALKQYQSCAMILEDELQVEPGIKTRDLYERIHLAIQFPGTLPPESSFFIGRSDELENIQRRIRTPFTRLITLKGIGGNGKSRLALRIGHQLQQHFINGVYYVSLATINHADAVPTCIATNIGIDTSLSLPLAEQVINFFAKREALLILDNFEHVIDATDFVSRILEAASQLSIIVTSREALQLKEEYIISVEGFNSPDDTEVSTATAIQYESIQFFTSCMQKQGVDSRVDEQTQSIVSLCRILQGSPLGIELATALLPVMSIPQLVTAVQNDLDILHSQLRNQPDRHKSLRAVFNQSWQTLNPLAQNIFAKLSIFRGSFTLKAAYEVADTDIAVIKSFVSKSLLQVISSNDGEPRYIMHELLRQYALEYLSRETDLYQEARDLHIRYYCHHLQDIDEDTSQEVVLSCVESEFSNIHAAWQYAVDVVELELLRELVIPLHRYYEYRSWWHEGAELLRKPINQFPELEHPIMGMIYSHLAGLSLRLGQVADAYEYIQKALKFLNDSGSDMKSIAFAWNVSGITEIYRGNLEVAINNLNNCVKQYAALNLPQHMLKPLVNLGSANFRAGHYDDAIKVMENGLQLAEELDDKHAQSHILTNLGATYQTIGEYQAALQCYERSIPISDMIDNSLTKATSLMNLSEICLIKQQFGDAWQYSQQAVDILGQTDEKRNYSLALSYLALSYLGLREIDQARDHLIKSFRIARETQSIPTILNVFSAIAQYYQVFNEDDKVIRILNLLINHPATEQGVRKSAIEQLDEFVHKNDVKHLPLEDIESLENIVLMDLDAK